MRDFKFRAWVTASKKASPAMFQDRDLALVFKLDNKGGFEKLHAEEYVLMQYTGLKDLNGKEIYEGDIIAGGWVVTWRNGGLQLHLPKVFDGSIYTQLSDNLKCEVIGNIYQNSELLEDKK